MDEVDRMFECFKCSFSPPQSAIRQKKKENRSLLPDDSAEDSSSNSHIAVSTSGRESHENPRPLIGKRKQFSPLLFYGSPQGVPPKKPARLLRLLHEIRTEHNKLRQDVWATFPRQEEAMKCCKEHAGSRVFSYQDHVNGQRRFLVSTYKEFWRRYKLMNPRFRHHYEVIQEGLPCHLYFDLEFNKMENMEKKGDEMVDLLLVVVFDALREKYHIEANHDCVIELDSSTKEKFSRHLILRLPQTAFKDNLHAGAFVAEVCSRINISRETDGKFNNLFVSKDSNSAENQCQLFVDTAVYSRNRCFRLPLSSKAGKNSVLLPIGRFRCKDMNEEEMFMASLICSMDIDCEKLLICKMDLDCVKVLHFDSEKHVGLSKELDFNYLAIDETRSYMMGKSPFPALDVFVETLATIGNVSGKIRSWYWFSECALMVYSMSRNRYCERIGRQHKSNHVIYVVDIRRGVYYQKCHDPDCSGYRSPLRSVPENVLPSPIIFLDLAGNCEVQSSTGEGNLIESCVKEDWWIEAMKLADEIESTQKSLDLTKMMNEYDEREKDDDDDDEWWEAVVTTASHTESMYLSAA